MNVPGIPQYLDEEDVAALRVGDSHRVDSGLGGSFNIRFEGHDGDRFVFRNVSQGWEKWPLYDFSFDEVRTRVYDIVAADPNLRRLQ